jgi:hypothetical protein
VVRAGAGFQAGLPLRAGPKDPAIRLGNFLRRHQFSPDEIAALIFPDIGVLEFLERPFSGDRKRETNGGANRERPEKSRLPPGKVEDAALPPREEQESACRDGSCRHKH